MGALLDHIRSYYDALNSGDADLVASHFTDDATHYSRGLRPPTPSLRLGYPRITGPHEGAQTIGEHTHMAVDQIDGQWVLEQGIEDGERTVIEWSMTWSDPKSGAPRLDRGTEWFEFRDGRIAEVRAYHHGGPKNPSGDLLGFDHAGRGYTTL